MRARTGSRTKWHVRERNPTEINVRGPPRIRARLAIQRIFHEMGNFIQKTCTFMRRIQALLDLEDEEISLLSTTGHTDLDPEE